MDNHGELDNFKKACGKYVVPKKCLGWAIKFVVNFNLEIPVEVSYFPTQC